MHRHKKEVLGTGMVGQPAAAAAAAGAQTYQSAHFARGVCREQILMTTVTTPRPGGGDKWDRG